MRFKPVKRFIGTGIDDVISWLKTELTSGFRELYIGLDALKFTENFKNYQWTGTLEAGETRQIPHGLRLIPSGYLIIKQIGNGVIDASESSWTSAVVYLRNNGGVPVELTAIFFA